MLVRMANTFLMFVSSKRVIDTTAENILRRSDYFNIALLSLKFKPKLKKQMLKKSAKIGIECLLQFDDTIGII